MQQNEGSRENYILDPLTFCVKNHLREKEKEMEVGVGEGILEALLAVLD